MNEISLLQARLILLESILLKQPDFVKNYKAAIDAIVNQSEVPQEMKDALVLHLQQLQQNLKIE